MNVIKRIKEKIKGIVSSLTPSKHERFTVKFHGKNILYSPEVQEFMVKYTFHMLKDKVEVDERGKD